MTIPDAGTRCWGQAAKTDSPAAGMWVTAAEVRSKDARKVDMAVSALVVATQPEEEDEERKEDDDDEEEEEKEEEEEVEEVPAAGSGAACSASLGRRPCA